MHARLRRAIGNARRCLGMGSFVVLGCAPEVVTTPPVPGPSDASRDRPRSDVDSLPEPPPECDEILPSAAMDTPSTPPRFEWIYTHSRAVGDDVYYRSTRQGGIWVVTVPDTAPRLVVPPLTGAPFQDFWIEEDTIYLASFGALYSAPRSGGPATLMPNHAQVDLGGIPPPMGDPAQEIWWMYARAGEFVYFVGPESASPLRRVRFAGGPHEIVGKIPYRVDPPVAGDGLVYYSAWGVSVEPPTSDSLWSHSIADDPSKSSLVKIFEGARGFSLLGYNAGLYARLDGDTGPIGLFPRGFAAGQVPEPVLTEQPVKALFGSAMFRGDLYFMGTRWFRAPDGSGPTQMPLLLRVSPGSTRAELVRCVSLQREGAPPKYDQLLFGNVHELFASETGVFQTAGPVNVTSVPGKTTMYPRVVKVWPPPK